MTRAKACYAARCMNAHFTQFSWPVSPYSAKTRTYLRFKRIPFDEVEPSARMLFRDIKREVGAAITAAAFLIPWTGLDRSSIFYYPYPRLTIPTFSLVLGMATWGLVAPALVIMVDSLDGPRDSTVDEQAAIEIDGQTVGRSKETDAYDTRGGRVPASSL